MERTVKQILMTALTTLVKMEDRALIKLTHTNVFVEFRLLVETATRKWTLVHLINVAIQLAAHQAQTIKISTVHVLLATQEDYAMKTSTNVSFLLHLAGMELHARIPMALINASARKGMKEKIVQSTLTTVLRSHVKMAELVSMALEITLVCAMTVSKENTVKLISTNAFLSPVRTERLAINTSIHTLAHVD